MTNARCEVSCRHPRVWLGGRSFHVQEIQPGAAFLKLHAAELRDMPAVYLATQRG